MESSLTSLFGCLDCCLVVSLLESLDTVCAMPHIAQRVKYPSLTEQDKNELVEYLKPRYTEWLRWTTCRASSALGMCVSAQTFHPSSAITLQLPFEITFDIRNRVSNLLLEPPCNSPERPTKLFSQRPQTFHLSGCRILRCNLCIPTYAWKTLVQALKTEGRKCRS
jgi:hypothetical protein